LKNKDKIRLGVVGCGAIAEKHIKVLSKKSVCFTVVVDNNASIAKQMQKKYGFQNCAYDYKDIYDLVDIVYICLPNYLHSPVSIDFLLHGIGVLCQKPIAVNELEVKMMIAAAEKTGALLYPAHVMRFYWSYKKIKEIISLKSMGSVLKIDVEIGGTFGWPTKSGFYFDKNKSGGGVLIDLGSHFLDLILWFLEDYPQKINYVDDNFGGVEAEAELEMCFPKNIHVSVKLSRLRKLRNVMRIKMEKGEITVKTYEPNIIVITDNNLKETFISAPIKHTESWCYKLMLDDFINSVINKSLLSINPIDILPSIKLIDQCYLESKHFDFSWL